MRIPWSGVFGVNVQFHAKTYAAKDSDPLTLSLLLAMTSSSPVIVRLTTAPTSSKRKSASAGDALLWCHSSDSKNSVKPPARPPGRRPQGGDTSPAIDPDKPEKSLLLTALNMKTTA
jgi:hypothetical protein